MPTYQITYTDPQHKVQDSEVIIMKNLGAAKRSARHHAPDGNQYIEIRDLMDKKLALYDQDEGWQDV